MRNHEAKNLMKEMKVGDKVGFSQFLMWPCDIVSVFGKGIVLSLELQEPRYVSDICIHSDGFVTTDTAYGCKEWPALQRCVEQHDLI